MMQEDDEVCERQRARNIACHLLQSVLQMVIYFLIMCHIMMSTRTMASSIVIAVAAWETQLSVSKLYEVFRGPWVPSVENSIEIFVCTAQWHLISCCSSVSA